MSAAENCSHRELAVGWAVHALEPGDEDAFVEHLPECAECRQVVRQTEELMWLLAASETQREPRLELRNKVLEEVARTPQQPRPAEPATASTRTSTTVAVRTQAPKPGLPADDQLPAAASSSDSEPPDGGLTPGPSPEQRRHARRQRRQMLTIATVMVGLLGLGGIWVRAATIDEQRETVTEQAQRMDQILADLNRPGAPHALLTAPNGRAVAAVLLYDGRAQVVPIELPPNASQRTTYVLWGMGTGDPIPVGAFDVGQQQTAPVALGSSPQADEFPSYAISVEQGGVPPGSPSLVIASGQVAS